MDDLLELKCLGSFEAKIKQIHLHEQLPIKAQGLLCYLALRPGGHSRTHLANLLWSEVPEQMSRGSLRFCISALRKSLDKHLEVNRNNVALSKDASVVVDALKFKELIERNDEQERKDQSLWQAIQLFRGDFLEGFETDESPVFEEWMIKERVLLRDMLIQALLWLSNHYLNIGDQEKGIYCTSRILHLEPWREEAHYLRMLHLARSGQRAAAIAQYRDCERILNEELKISPMPATRELFRRITAGSTRRLSLPDLPTPFVGREKEISNLTALINQDHCRLLTLIGPGGVGKTRLALELARGMAHCFMDGVCFVPLEQISMTEQIPSAISSALQYEFRGKQTTDRELLDYLEAKEMLLILDNYEHLSNDPSYLLSILEQAENITLLVTSRVSLRLMQERVVKIDGLSYPNQVSKDFESYDAVRLFLQTAERVRGHPLDSPEIPEAVKICSIVEGIPLGIELAACSARINSLPSIHQAISENLTSYVTSMINVIPRHRSLGAAFDYSWKILSQNERSVLSPLFVFRGGFDAISAAAIVGESHSVAPILSSLTATSWINISDNQGQVRYQLLESIRQYVEEKVDKYETEEIRQRHLDYFVGLSAEAEIELRGPRQKDWLQKLETEIGNLRAAIQWGCDHKPLSVVKLITALKSFWITMGHLVEAQNALDVCYGKSVAQLPNALVAKSLLLDCELAFLLGDYDCAKKANSESMALYKVLNDKTGIISCLRVQGQLLMQEGQMSEAEEKLSSGLQIANEIHDTGSKANMLYLLGNLKVNQGENEVAVRLYDEAIFLRREVGDAFGIAAALGNLGVTKIHLKEFSTAEKCLQECISIQKGLGNKLGQAIALNNLGALFEALKEYKRAQEYLEESLLLKRESGARKYIVATLQSLGGNAVAQQEYSKAYEYYSEGLFISKRLGTKSTIAKLLAGIAWVLCQTGKLSEASKLLGAANSLFKSANVSLNEFEQKVLDENTAMAARELGQSEFSQCFEDGRAMRIDEVIEFASSQQVS